MAQQQITLTPASLILHPTHLLVGQNQATKQTALTVLQQLWCKKKGCKKCTTCLLLESHNHTHVRWLKPEKNNYKKEELEAIFEAVIFQLSSQEHFFFVIEKADYLNQTCANSLLKIIEEPPANYHFLLLCEQSHNVAITLRSRCLTHVLQATSTIFTHPLLRYFTHWNNQEFTSFNKYLESIELDDQEHKEILHHLYAELMLNYKQNELKITYLIEFVGHQLTKAPTPGSQKIIWRNLYLQFLLYHQFKS